jgi:hypothetical protein
MNTLNKDAGGAGWRKAGALGLAIAVIGLPINNISDYALLLLSAVMILCGDVRATPRAWVAAAVIAIAAVLGQALLSTPRIQEGYNVFLPGSVQERGRPSDVYRRMTAEFDAQSPAAQGCDRRKLWFW